jgi:Mce-associated membrane protein
MTTQLSDADADAADVDVEDPPARVDRSWFGFAPVVVVLVVVAALLAGLGGWFLLRTADLRDDPAAANTALVDTGRTAEVSAAITVALNRIFSYSYDRTEVTERAAADVLRGDARDTYDKLFAQVRELAPNQKLVLTTQVVSAAVQELGPDSATLLVFLDQSATRADKDASSAAAAQLSVTARLEGDRWVITGLAPR